MALHLEALVVPTINFVIFGAILIFVGKKKIVDYFEGRFQNIKDQYEKAESRHKEASEKLSILQKKIAHIDDEKRSWDLDVQKELHQFEKEYQIEVEKKIERLRLDVEDNLKAEKNSILSMIRKNFVKEVLQSARERIVTDNSYRKQISKKMLELIK